MSISAPADIREDRALQTFQDEVAGGYVYIRRVNAGQLAEADLLGAGLAPGVVMPVNMGGPATANAEDARLQTIQRRQQGNGARDQWELQFIQLFTRAGAVRSATYIETRRSRPTKLSAHARQITTHGVCTTEADGPQTGDHLDAGTGLLDYICQDRVVTPNWQFGRHLVTCEWLGLIAQPGAVETGGYVELARHRKLTWGSLDHVWETLGVATERGASGAPRRGDYMNPYVGDPLAATADTIVWDEEPSIGRVMVTVRWVGRFHVGWGW